MRSLLLLPLLLALCCATSGERRYWDVQRDFNTVFAGVQKAIEMDNAQAQACYILHPSAPPEEKDRLCPLQIDREDRKHIAAAVRGVVQLSILTEARMDNLSEEELEVLTADIEAYLLELTLIGVGE